LHSLLTHTVESWEHPSRICRVAEFPAVPTYPLLFTLEKNAAVLTCSFVNSNHVALSFLKPSLRVTAEQYIKIFPLLVPFSWWITIYYSKTRSWREKKNILYCPCFFN